MEWEKEITNKIQNANSLTELEELRLSIFGKKGKLTSEFSNLKNLNDNDKKDKARLLNEMKTNLENLIFDTKNKLKTLELEQKIQSEAIDVSLFKNNFSPSYGHPINLIFDKIIDYFIGASFAIKYGPLVENDFYNFEALNLPKFHPARDMQDTFYFNDSMLLRTHTSPVQIRTMEQGKLPIRIISPGAVFRRDYDMTHSPMFHQIEGLVVDENPKINFANLKYILEDFLTYIFGDIKIRFRSSYFPFTEPSAEVDISCIFCKGSGCRVCSHTGWLEVLGCGVVNNNVFNAVGLKNVSGYAFGMGVERFAMLLYGVNDLRSFFETDLRLLEQF
ncbi:MAG: phenylalanine--tRNA ligase subunit alpha [Helicobacteraceae bacterium]|nr:phenylalanine--tRNA ligase subunit alpha [Helicobacteraceae bacterium]